MTAVVRKITRHLNEEVRDRVRALANTQAFQRSRRDRKNVKMRFFEREQVLWERMRPASCGLVTQSVATADIPQVNLRTGACGGCACLVARSRTEAISLLATD